MNDELSPGKKWLLENWHLMIAAVGAVFLAGAITGLFFPKLFPFELQKDHQDDIARLELKYDAKIAALDDEEAATNRNADTLASASKDLQSSVNALNRQISELQGRLDQMNSGRRPFRSSDEGIAEIHSSTHTEGCTWSDPSDYHCPGRVAIR